MAFIKKIWKDRISQFPNRRTINDGYVTKQVTVGRDEGTITEQGDAFDASNMNDLEQRIEDCYGDVQALVGSEVAAQYNQDNVIFDPVATEGHGTGFVVSSDYIANLKVGDLADTEISGQAQGEALVWDGTKWVNGTVSTVGNLDDLNDVDTSGKATGDSLRYDGNEWVAQPTTVALTQAEYDALQTKEPNTHYVITDAPNLNPTASDIEYSSGVTVKQAIDSKQDTLTYETDDYSVATYGGVIRCKKWGRMVNIQGYSIGTSQTIPTGQALTLATIASKYRPNPQQHIMGTSNSGSYKYDNGQFYRINTDGTIVIYVYAGTSFLNGNFNVTYIV